MISVMEGDKQVAGIPVKIVKSTNVKNSVKTGWCRYCDLRRSLWDYKNVIIRKEHGTITTSFVFFLFTALIYIRFIIWLKLYKSRYFISKKWVFCTRTEFDLAHFE